MPITTIAPGDTVSRIAGATGFAPDTIWSHPDNAELRATRDHMDVLGVGDQLTVPDLTLKSVSVAACKRYRFRRKGVPMRLIVQILNVWGDPRKNEPYRLIVDGSPLSGTTDNNGVIREYLPTSASEAKLRLKDLEFDLAIGVLEPKSELLGAQQRLSNLGFPCMADNGEMGQSTLLALIRFQRLAKIEETGRLDNATRDALNNYHQELNRLTQEVSNNEQT